MIPSKRNFFKIKVALFFGYNGKGYQGLQSQKDPSVKTIEKSLLEGLVEAKLVNEQHKEELHKICWGRGARTDKGVHALCNGVSLKMSVAEDYLSAGSPLRLNFKDDEELETKNKEILEKETYKSQDENKNKKDEIKEEQQSNLGEKQQQDDEEEEQKVNQSHLQQSTQASEIKQLDSEIPKSGEGESKILTKFERDEINRQKNEENKKYETQMQQFAAERRKQIDVDKILNELNNHLPWDIRAIAIKQVNKKFDIRLHCKYRVYEYIMPLFAFQNYENMKSGVKITNEEESNILAKAQALALKFKGTHNYFNFTRQIKAKDPRCFRYILNMETELILSKEGNKYIRFTLQGQSFVYHQIRKMMGMICLMIHQNHPDSYLEASLSTTPTKVWLAPAHGLFLNRMRFDGYNKKSEIVEPVEFNEKEEVRIKQMRDIIEGNVMNPEESNSIYKQWLQNCIEGKDYAEDNDSVSGDIQDE